MCQEFWPQLYVDATVFASFLPRINLPSLPFMRIPRRTSHFVSCLSSKMTEKWLEKDIKGFLLDITGVIYNSQGKEGSPVEGSIEAVQLLRQSGIPFRFCSNESTASRSHLAQKLQHLGFDIQADEITCPAPVAAALLKERNLRPFFLVKEEVLEEFEGINTTNPNCVVMGDAQDNFSYANINRAFSVLINSPKPILISMGCGRFYKETDGLKIDVGAFCKGLEYACSIKAEFVGKPNPEFFISAVEKLKKKSDFSVNNLNNNLNNFENSNLNNSENNNFNNFENSNYLSNYVMIGDDVQNDCGAAQKAGLRGVLVRTGKYRVQDEERTDVKPDGVVNNLLQAVQLFLAKKTPKS